MQPVPPVRVIAKKDHRPVLRQRAQTLQPAPRDGVKRAPRHPLEIEIERRVEHVVFIRRDHTPNLAKRRTACLQNCLGLSDAHSAARPIRLKSAKSCSLSLSECFFSRDLC